MSTIEKALAKQKLSNAEKATDNSATQTDASVVQSQARETIADASQTAPLRSGTINQQCDIVLHQQNLVQRGYLFDATDRRLTQEEFRHIKRKLLNNAFGTGSKVLQHSNLVMVSSSNPNEGKTFVSINLALSIALEQDKTVLLIDSDVLRPSIARELGFEEKTGLVEYLLSEVTSIQQVMYSTNIPNLKIIPSGKRHHLTNELLASQRMASLANELASRYPDRIVIFDCPPILGVTETPVLANLMGQAVIVVEESKTKINDIKKATSQLNEDLAIGFVMNKTLKSTKETYGYYGYGYGAKSQ